MDSLTPEHRSWNMSRIRGSNTKPERTIRSLLHRVGFRFQTRSGKSLPGRPDVVLRRYHVAVFVHGCFWHRHRGCRFAYNPKSRKTFWNKKFRNNQSRDKAVQLELRKLGWKQFVVWECEIRNLYRLTKRIEALASRLKKDQSVESVL